MQRFWEIILGLERGFLSREGEFALAFNPRWPGGEVVGNATWNVLLVVAAVALVWWVYRREARSRTTRLILAGTRIALLVLVIALLNRPVLTLTQSRTEASVLAILVDDSVSMKVSDITSDGAAPQSRLAAVQQLLRSEDAALLRELSGVHQIRFYRFSSTASAIEPATPDGQTDVLLPVVGAIESLQPAGQSTRVMPSLTQVVSDLQGQRVAGIVVLTDGRDTPAQPLNEQLAQIRDLRAKVYPVIVGTDQPARNIDVQSVSAEESAFVGDIVNIRVAVRGSGLEPGQPVQLRLVDANTGALVDAGGRGSTEVSVNVDDDRPVEAELQFKPAEVGTLDLIVEAVPIAGEINEQDNRRPLQISVLEAKITVLYVDGYPRWEYRYLKNELTRDPTIEVSCLLTSADPTFRQEGDKPITRFPESIEELLEYDVIIFGDVDPRQFTDNQLQLVADFVARRGGGFGMIAGPRFSPYAFRNTAIETILPVDFTAAAPDNTAGGTIAEGFRPALTRSGDRSGFFRFFADREVNDTYLRDALQPLFWYARNIAPKPGVGEIFAEHPTDTLQDGRRAPIIVVGRYGGGRTLFSGIDDTWRWRYYTGEAIFNTYWVQTLRYLARGKKLGDRRITLAAERPSYEIGEQVRIVLRALDPNLLTQLPEQIRVELTDAAGQPVRSEMLTRQQNQPDTWIASFQADREGALMARIAPIASGLDERTVRFDVNLPRLELVEPQIDTASLTRIATETGGRVVSMQQARELPRLIPSAERNTPVVSGQPLWDAPLAMALFILLITFEWVARKVMGML